jgi:NAD-dependent dihydropyrimidine dehydrogenase PreA subunit
MKGFEYLKKVATLKLDQAACIGCGMCGEVCPHQVFALEEKRAYIKDFDACIECGACARNCPVAAIMVDAGVGCATGLINEWLRERKVLVKGGDCCS